MSLKHLRKLDKWRTKRQIFRPKLSTTDKQYLKIASLRNKKKIQKRLDRTWEIHLALQLIHQLITNGLSERVSGRVAVKRPFLRKRSREKRLGHARLHKTWAENQWQQVLLERWLQIFNFLLKCHCYYRHSGERVSCQSTISKHGGVSAMVWDSISVSGAGDFVKIDDTMNTEKCCMVQCHMESISLATELFISMTMISNTLPME